MSTRPKEGIYLDAALGVIGEQIEERIDALTRLRRIRVRIAVVALSLLTVASGSLAAVALTTGLQPEAAPSVKTAAVSTAQIRCVEGTDASARPFFTAVYRIAVDVDVDGTVLCTSAQQMLATDAASIDAASPESLVIIAEGLLGEVADASGVRVDTASFGTLQQKAAAVDTQAMTCVDGDTTVVLLASPARAGGGLGIACGKGSE
ncbi:hypothetical protein [Microbacterium sp. PMB16]|uniref:hypothetical protein n=1 Tax=Microbacterium sp. PMB16 TaxID=3120157 RepID=UPI003F4B5F8D